MKIDGNRFSFIHFFKETLPSLGRSLKERIAKIWPHKTPPSETKTTFKASRISQREVSARLSDSFFGTKRSEESYKQVRELGAFLKEARSITSIDDKKNAVQNLVDLAATPQGQKDLLLLFCTDMDVKRPFPELFAGFKLAECWEKIGGTDRVLPILKDPQGFLDRMTSSMPSQEDTLFLRDVRVSLYEYFGKDGFDPESPLGKLLLLSESCLEPMLVVASPPTDIQVEHAKEAINDWDNRENWTYDEIVTRHKALTAVTHWVEAQHEIKNLPDQLKDQWPASWEEASQLKLPENCQLPAPILQTKLLNQPIKSLSEKLDQINEIGSGKIPKQFRLTIKEYYFLKSTAALPTCPSWLKEDTFTKWQTFAKNWMQRSTTHDITIQFLNPRHERKIDDATKKSLSLGKRFFHLFGHTDLVFQTKPHEFKAIAPPTQISNFLSPKIDEYELDLDKLIPPNVPEEKHARFKELFCNHLKNAFGTHLRSQIAPPNEAIGRILGRLRIRPPLNLAQLAQTAPKSAFCSEIVARSIVETVLEVCKHEDINVEPPSNPRFFGLSKYQDLKSLTPALLKQRLQRANILKPLNRMEQIIRF